MITTDKNGARTFYGTSSDTKPSGADAANGSCFLEMDTGNVYFYDAEGAEWRVSPTSGGGGTSDYADLDNKPQINGVTLSGNKTPANLGIKELPTVAAADAGKDLTVNSSGEWVAGKTASWTATVTIECDTQSATAEIGGTVFRKMSYDAFTAEQLNGAVITIQGGGEMQVSSSDLTDMSSLGVTGTMINVPDYGNIIFSCTEAGNIVSEPGFYIVSAMATYARYINITRYETLTAQTRAIGIGDMEMEDGVTDLPSGVVWLQYES